MQSIAKNNLALFYVEKSPANTSFINLKFVSVN